jgi:RNA 3'-phosphate cyclase
MRMITIDGTMGEGGGAVLRTALALSAVGMRPVHIYNIRAKRPNPGLAPQHMHGVKVLASLTDAKVEGLHLGSTELKFEPGAAKGGRYRVDIGTAGSITLILQALMPAAAFADGPVEVEITGGTDVPMSPPVDYLINVTLPILCKMGYDGEVTRVRRGHYPRGGGVVKAIIRPIQKLSAIHMTGLDGVVAIKGISHCVKLPMHVATRMAHAAKLALLKAGYANVDIEIEAYDPAGDPHLAPGAGITLWAEGRSGSIIGASALGRPGRPAEEVAREAAEVLLRQLRTGCGVDRYLTDQLIPYMALAEGTSEITSAELTSHALTNIALVERILDVRFEVDGQMGQPGRIRVEGLGFSRLQRL